MESLFAVVDIYFVSRLGNEAMAGVALTESVLSLIYTLAMGLSIGVTAVVSRRIGGGDREGAARAAAQAVLLGLALALVFGVAGVAFAPDILRIMGADENVVATGVPYTRIMLGGNVVILLLFLQNAAFRGAGDAAIAMRVLWIANGLNIVLDPLLIFGLGPFPEMGVQGAAVATTIGRGTAVLVQVYTLFRLGGKLRIRSPHLGIQPALMAQLVRLSATGMLQTFIATASWIGLTRVTALFGVEALAGYVVAIRIILFAILPAWGLSNAAATMVGQGLGAGDPERAERAVWISCKMNLAFLGAVSVFFIAFAPGIVGLFGGTAGASAVAVTGLRIVSIGFVFLRLRHGAHGGVQRGGGGLDAHGPQLLLFLAVGDPARLGPVPSRWTRYDRRVHRDDGVVLDAGGGERVFCSSEGGGGTRRCRRGHTLGNTSAPVSPRW